MKKTLFIDRDGTLILEPPINFQVDSLEKLTFYPGVITALSKIAKLDYELVLVTNQDGLGTDSFPEAYFWKVHNKMVELFENEGIIFKEQFIDRSFEWENKPTRKPSTGMLTEYCKDCDLAASFVIGDRLTDVQLAKNLGAKAIWLSSVKNSECALTTTSWNEIYTFLRLGERQATVERRTNETNVLLTLDLDGNCETKIETGLNFFNHMLSQIVHHSSISMTLIAKGDTEVDEHHTVEDVAIVMGEAIRKALGNKQGSNRYGFTLPMDECDATVVMDLGGRIDFRWEATFARERIGDMPTELFEHFFKSLAHSAMCNLHITAIGTNEHHKIEGIFKAFARALKMAIERNPEWKLPTSKGVI